ncbi:MAG: hypothetical protein D3909_08765 [Candidatus Electrothrix sp. ATG1]|nr:hypothetical protein [Candidatus Electrothrix sp. ATG1]
MPWNILQRNTLNNLNDNTYANFMRAYDVAPTVVLTGDGHRNPPFRWAVNPDCHQLTERLLELQERDALFFYVEQHQGQVDGNSVPPEFQPSLGNDHVIGWELPIYLQLQPIMEACLVHIGNIDILNNNEQNVALAQNMLNTLNEIAELDFRNQEERFQNQEERFQALIGLAEQVGERHVFLMEGIVGNHHFNNNDDLNALLQFFQGYLNTAMEARTQVNDLIANVIQPGLINNPDSTHLITCGNAHILHNPLHNFINLPEGVIGIVDAL